MGLIHSLNRISSVAMSFPRFLSFSPCLLAQNIFSPQKSITTYFILHFSRFHTMSYAQSWLDFEAASGGRMVLQGTPADIKESYRALVETISPHFPPPSGNVTVKNGEVSGVKYRTYTPKNASGPLPTAIWSKFNNISRSTQSQKF